MLTVQLAIHALQQLTHQLFVHRELSKIKKPKLRALLALLVTTVFSDRVTAISVPKAIHVRHQLSLLSNAKQAHMQHLVLPNAANAQMVTSANSRNPFRIPPIRSAQPASTATMILD